MNDIKEPVAYIPGRPGIVAMMRAGKDGVMRSTIGGKSIDELQTEYPGCVITDLEAAVTATEDIMRSPPVEIDAETFRYCLEVLPPIDWTHKGGCETFKLSEYTSGIITTICARVGTKYYQMQDRVTMTHDEILALILNPKE